MGSLYIGAHVLIKDRKGLYCPKGDFYIDPRQPVGTALITHAHGDHARFGSSYYYAHRASVGLLHYRLGKNIHIKPLEYRERKKIGSVWVSFHPAGHILGSSQIRIEDGSNVTVVSGDYKLNPDPTCEPFELLECDLFITESTFAMPIYHWEESNKIISSIHQWWQKNASEGHPSLLFCYSLGKSQRILATLRKFTDEDVFIHGAIAPINICYENEGVSLLKTHVVTQEDPKTDYSKALILAPLSAYRSPWMKRFKYARTAFASGWMAVRGTRRRQGFDQGFVLSDHADWPDLIKTILGTKAKKVLVTHGETEIFSRYLNEVCNIHAEPLPGFVPQEED